MTCVRGLAAGVATRRRERRRPVLQAVANQGTTSPRVVIVGGTGRVGRSTAKALADLFPGVRLVLAARNASTFADVVSSASLPPAVRSAEWVACDLAVAGSLDSVLQGADLVVHAAGVREAPTQGHGAVSFACPVLESAIRCGVAYLDACDDTDAAARAVSLNAAAAEAGVRAIVCGGIFPGVSNLMAASMVRAGREDGRGTPVRLSFSYFTAGSGGVGTTILASTFLLCAQDAVVFADGKRTLVPPLSGRRVVDFGPKAGFQEVFLYALPEVSSAASLLGVPSVSARFGTSPGLWNAALSAVVALVPRDKLLDRRFADALASLSSPAVRFVDALVGEQTAMRVDVAFEREGGATASSSLFVDRKLSVAVGRCLAAFAADALEHPLSRPAGVMYPEAVGAVGDVPLLLSRAANGCRDWQLDKAAWQIDTKTKQLAFGM